MGVRRDIAEHAYTLANARSQVDIPWCRDLIDETLATSDSDLGYLVVSAAILQSVNVANVDGLLSLQKKLKKRRKKRKKQLEERDEWLYCESEKEEMEKRLVESRLRHNHALFFSKYLVVNESSKAASLDDYLQRIVTIREAGVDISQISFSRVIDDLLNCELEGARKVLKEYLDAIAYSGDTYDRALKEIECRLPDAMGQRYQQKLGTEMPLSTPSFLASKRTGAVTEDE